MPNRIIKDSITKSEKLSDLTDFQFRLWVHLITYVDDYGRGDARPAIIRGACFPLRDRMTNKDIEKGLADLAGAGCVGLYKVDGKPYLYFPNWEQHQRVRQKVSKCPSPDDCDEEIPVATSCGELPQDAARIQSRIQNPNPESRIRIRARRAERSLKNFGLLIPAKRGSRKQEQPLKKLPHPWKPFWKPWSGRKLPPNGRRTVGSLSPILPPGSTGSGGKTSCHRLDIRRADSGSWMLTKSKQ